MISGGASAGFYQVARPRPYRSGNGWHVDARSNAGSDTTLTVFAYCLAGVQQQLGPISTRAAQRERAGAPGARGLLLRSSSAACSDGDKQ